MLQWLLFLRRYIMNASLKDLCAPEAHSSSTVAHRTLLGPPADPTLRVRMGHRIQVFFLEKKKKKKCWGLRVYRLAFAPSTRLFFLLFFLPALSANKPRAFVKGYAEEGMHIYLYKSSLCVFFFFFLCYQALTNRNGKRRMVRARFSDCFSTNITHIHQ